MLVQSTMNFFSSPSNSEVKQPAQQAFALGAPRRPRVSLTVKRPGKTKRSRKSKGKKSLISQMGDMTLRDAADMTQAVIRGGLRIATSVFNVEEKVLDTMNNTNYTSTGTVENLSFMAQGSNYNQRDGLSVRARNLVINYYAVFNSLGSGTQTVRVILFQDLEYQGTPPGPTNVIELASVVAPYLHYVGDRFRVLADQAEIITSAKPGTYHRIVCPVDSHITYKGPTSASADGWNGQLFALIISDQAANAPTVNWYARLDFVDN